MGAGYWPSFRDTKRERGVGVMCVTMTINNSLKVGKKKKKTKKIYVRKCFIPLLTNSLYFSLSLPSNHHSRQQRRKVSPPGPRR